MKVFDFFKLFLVPVTAIWLAGCASTGQTTGGAEEIAETTGDEQEEMVVGTVAMYDEDVQSVIDSGEMDATPEQIEAYLDKTEFRFAYDSAKLGNFDYEALDAQAIYLNSDVGSSKSIIIQGHTDARGTRTYNLALGERRANSVKNYLVSKGVAPDRVDVISFGFEKPVDPAQNESAWGKNRRAQIVIN